MLSKSQVKIILYDHCAFITTRDWSEGYAPWGGGGGGEGGLPYILLTGMLVEIFKRNP